LFTVSPKLVLKRKVPCDGSLFTNCVTNTVVVAQIKQAKIKIQIVLKLPLNPKSALKPLASFKLGSMTSVTAGGVRSKQVRSAE
jgi:hypothetical protein